MNTNYAASVRGNSTKSGKDELPKQWHKGSQRNKFSDASSKLDNRSADWGLSFERVWMNALAGSNTQEFIESKSKSSHASRNIQDSIESKGKLSQAGSNSQDFLESKGKSSHASTNSEDKRTIQMPKQLQEPSQATDSDQKLKRDNEDSSRI